MTTDKKNWILIAIALLIAVALRVTASSSDSLDYDTYSLMFGVEKSYNEYIRNSFGIAQKTHYWLSYRLFGGGLLSFRAIPIILQFLTIIALVVGVMKLWPQEQYMTAVSLLLLAYNSHSLYTTSYGMVTYSCDILIGLVFFFYFVRISEREICLGKVAFFGLLIFPIVVFSSVMTVVPLSVGVFSVFIWRVYLYSSGRISISAVANIYKLWPLLYIPAIHALIWWVFPFTNLGSDKRPDMHWLFFSQSTFASDFYGIFGFWLYNSGKLISGLIKPAFSSNLFSRHAALHFFFYALLVGSAVYSMRYLLVRHRVDPKTRFSIFYFLIAYCAILAGGLLGWYPFGDVRYAGWLIGPVVILVGYVLSKGVLKLQRLAIRGLFPVLFIIVAASGILFNIVYYNAKSAEKKTNYAAVRFAIESGADRYLISSYNQTVLSILAPQIFVNGLDIGWGTYYGNGSDGGEKDPRFALFTDSVENEKVDLVTVISLTKTQFSDLYPTWSNYLGNHYMLKREVHAPALWVGEYALIKDWKN